MTKDLKHTDWLVDTGERVETADGEIAAVWDFNHVPDEATLSIWARHFRNHYCLDSAIDFLRGGRSRRDYLIDIKFPATDTNLGPGIRAGDFGEILIADYLEWLLGYWVPRVRWSSKIVRDESPKGSDVIGFHFHKKSGASSQKDEMAVYESKTKFSKSKKNRVQDAINDSAKDHLRLDESLNYIKQKLFESGDSEDAARIERFQSPVDAPYRKSFGAVAIISTEFYTDSEIEEANCNEIPVSRKSKNVVPHPNKKDLTLLVVRGPNMMELVHELYKRAADEA